MNKNIEKRYKKNNEINYDKVRVVNSKELNGIVSIDKAINISSKINKDVVLINSKTSPPIVMIINYNKFLYKLKKKNKLIKKKIVKNIIKEIRISPYIDTHDIKYKIKNCIKFLKHGDRVKLSLLFKGRSIIYQEQGKNILLKCMNSLKEYYNNNNNNNFIKTGRWLSIMLYPKKIK